MNIGPITLPPWLLMIAAAVFAGFIVDQFYVRRSSSESSVLLRDLALDAFLIIVIVSQLYPALHAPSMIWRDPIGFIYRPVGTAGVAAGVGAFLLYAAVRLLRRRPLPRGFFRYASADTGAFVLTFAVLALLFPLLSSRSPSAGYEVAQSGLRSRLRAMELEQAVPPETGTDADSGAAPHEDAPLPPQAEKIHWDADYLVVNLWATWCPPCRGEIPELNAFYEGSSREQVELIAVNLTRTEKSVQNVYEFMEKHSMRFPVLLDPRSRINSLIDTESIPTTVVVGPDGEIRAFKKGTVSRTWLEQQVDGGE
jgi:thiol-disulfide isomerase/thioredoxin